MCCKKGIYKSIQSFSGMISNNVYIYLPYSIYKSISLTSSSILLAVAAKVIAIIIMRLSNEMMITHFSFSQSLKTPFEKE